MKCQNVFLWKSKKNISYCHPLKFLPSMLIIKKQEIEIRHYPSDALSQERFFCLCFVAGGICLTSCMPNFPYAYLTCLSLAAHKRDIGKLCRPRSDVTECGI